MIYIELSASGEYAVNGAVIARHPMPEAKYGMGAAYIGRQSDDRAVSAAAAEYPAEEAFVVIDYRYVGAPERLYHNGVLVR